MTQFHDRIRSQLDHQQFARSLRSYWELLDNPSTQIDYARRVLDHNNETMKDNLYHLETATNGARQQQWLCMDVFLHRYIDAERKRLAIRLKLMEEYHIEHHHNPYNALEHALFTELLQLTGEFLEAAKERDAQLVEKFRAEPSGPRQHNVYQHRRDAEMCANVYQWLTSWDKSEETPAQEVPA